VDHDLIVVETDRMSARYTFGDNELAARRLALVAEVFEATSRTLVASSIRVGAPIVLDLGCGPGYTTRLLAHESRPRRVLGLDSSARFLVLARELTAETSVAYAVHDATELPLPEGPVDALYARLLLAHLPDPLALVERWLTQLRPGGVLVLDEVEAIEAPPGVLREYESLVAGLVEAEGGSMYAGPLLEPLGGRCVEVHVDTAVAARMYGMNLATWQDDARRLGLAGPADLARIREGLAGLRSRPGAGSVRWLLRQVVLTA
jgi:SAM-dependent methyltransferase